MAEAAAQSSHPLVVLNTYLHERTDSLKNALPPHIKPDRFISSVMTAVQLNPDLIACDRRSLWLACIRCAQDGLLPDGQEAAIVPYKQKASYLPMYQGLLKKFRNSGQFKWVTAGIAYDGEEYSHWIDENGEHFKHVPSNDSPERKVKRVYALATTKDGGFFIADLSQADINKRRAMSRASRDDAPWKQWPDEMMKKTAIRMLSKLLPKSSDLDFYMQRDEQESLGVQTAETITDQRGAAFGNVLDHFAGSGEEDDAVSKTEAEASASVSDADSGGQSVGASTTGAQPVANASASAPAAENLAKAYKLGQIAKTNGVSRKAVPPEYRGEAHAFEGLAWIAGYDGTSMPAS